MDDDTDIRFCGMGESEADGYGSTDPLLGGWTLRMSDKPCSTWFMIWQVATREEGREGEREREGGREEGREGG